MPSLAELPLPLAVIVAAFWIINQANAANAKQIVALLDAFNKEYNALVGDYKALVQMALDDRKEARERWLERDRLLNERLERATTEMAQNKSETHQLRNLIQSVSATIELIAREVLPSRGARRGTTKPSGAADD